MNSGAYFGRIVSEKGIADLIRALGQLKNYRWTLLIDDFTGFENSFSKELKYLIDKENIKNRVIYINATHLEMSAYMNATDIVVVPSRTTKTFKEQYGRVVPESMACGKLVIATNSGTLPELLGEAGVVIPEGDLEILTKTIKDATLRFHEFKSLRMKASQRAINELSVTAQADILQHWYEKVISSRV